MRRRPIQYRWGIRKRVLFLAVVPMFLVSISIGFYLTYAHLTYMRGSLEDHGRILARNLALSSEFSLVINDKATLNNLVKHTHFRPEVAAVIIYDASGNILAENIRKHKFKPLPRHVMEFSADVLSTSLSGGESEELKGAADNGKLGRVSVYISRDQLRERARDIILRSVLVILSGLLISSLLAVLLARELLLPVQRIIRLVDKVQRGDLSSRLARKSGTEMGELEQGINLMVKTIEGSQKELESRVESATAKLQETVEALQQKNIALEEARREAVEANQAKERFLAHVSHELRTPLSAIVGFAELLKTTKPKHEQSEYVRIINNASQQLLGIINDVLSYSELSAGTMQIESTSFDPETVLEDVVSLMSRDAHRKELELVLLVHRDTPASVIGDPTRLSQVLTNLLNNAVKFTTRGEILVTSDSVTDDQGMLHLRVSVEDSGIGIADEIKDSLFEPFVQGDSSIQKRFGGTGLGLAISRSLMEQMHGRLYVAESALQGSRFCILLPADTKQQTANSAIKTELTGLKVLVVDSHAVSRRAIKNVLLYFGMKVYLQSPGRNFARLLQDASQSEEPFEIVVMGCSAREMQDVDMARLNRLSKEYRLKILILVSDEEVACEAQVKWQKYSRIAISTKPVRRQRLQENLLQLIHGHKQKKMVSVPTAKKVERVEKDQLQALVADDNEFSRRLLTIALRRLGIAAMQVEDGFATIELAKTKTFDLIFLDVHMPDLDGLTVSRIIREKTSNRQTPIIAVTADLFVNELEDGNRTIDAILHKPVAEEKLKSTINGLIRNSEQEKLNTNDETNDIPDAVHAADFAQAIQELAEKLTRAVEQQDRKEMKEICHQINGLTGFFGLSRLSSQGRRVEKSITEGSDKDLQVLVQQLIDAINKL